MIILHLDVFLSVFLKASILSPNITIVATVTFMGINIAPLNYAL